MIFLYFLNTIKRRKITEKTTNLREKHFILQEKLLFYRLFLEPQLPGKLHFSLQNYKKKNRKFFEINKNVNYFVQNLYKPFCFSTKSLS